MQQWEYMHILLPHTGSREVKVAGEKVMHIHQIEAVLNELGAQGWEVVTSVSNVTSMSGIIPYFTLKRPKPQPR